MSENNQSVICDEPLNEGYMWVVTCQLVKGHSEKHKGCLEWDVCKHYDREEINISLHEKKIRCKDCGESVLE